jgi:hypothetical protein
MFDPDLKKRQWGSSRSPDRLHLKKAAGLLSAGASITMTEVI